MTKHKQGWCKLNGNKVPLSIFRFQHSCEVRNQPSTGAQGQMPFEMEYELCGWLMFVQTAFQTKQWLMFGQKLSKTKH